MDKVLVLNEKTLNRIPPIFTLIFVLLLGSPAIALHYFGIDFGSITSDLVFENSLEALIVETQIRDYFNQTLLQWSAFSLAALTTLFALTQYRLTQDKIALIIGLTILFSGSVQVLNTLIINVLSPHIVTKVNWDVIIWTFTNTASGIIITIGLLLLLKNENKHIFILVTSTLLKIIVVFITLACLYYGALSIKTPTPWFDHPLPARPYELIYLSVYLVLIFFIYPKAYKKYPNLLTNSILYMAITHIATAIYLIFLSTSHYDNAYHIAYFLKIITCFIPFSCLIINYVFSYNSILEAQNKLQISQEKLSYIASHDSLTCLYNRREFENILDKTIANHSRYYDSFALFLIDIDNFKSINDTLGHIHGDSFLKKFSEQLTKLTRQGDIISRIGGDEFTIIMSTLKSPSSARKLADRIISGLNIPYLVNDKLLTGTVSVGISIYPIDGESTEELLKNADIAMYNAKKSGKNTFRFYTEKLSKEQHREAEIESHLRAALITDELSLAYQPQYNLLTNEVIGAEILLRWKSKGLGDVSPDEFIPVAENSNLIILLGNWVLSKTCEQATYWLEKYQRHLLFSINVSPIQFTNNNFYLNFKKTIETFNYPAHYLNIEITESLLIDNNVDVSLELNNIGALGTKISLDDFGMGYSSLSRLKSLPINTLKIDKLFVADIHNKNNKVIIIDTIIKLAHELGMTAIAEGIETSTQLNYLISKNCLVGQGYFLNNPLTAEAFEKTAY